MQMFRGSLPKRQMAMGATHALHGPLHVANCFYYTTQSYSPQMVFEVHRLTTGKYPPWGPYSRQTS